MKYMLSALLLSSLAIQADNESEDYLNFVIQIQNDTYQTTHKMDDLAPSGSATALKGVETSSTFQLWTINRDTGAEYLLDEKIVSAYHPTAEIAITTNDPYTGVPRTRVDQPFKVSYTMEGLVTDDEAPAAAKSATLTHLAVTYDNINDESSAFLNIDSNQSYSYGLGKGLGLLKKNDDDDDDDDEEEEEDDDDTGSLLGLVGDILDGLFGDYEGFGDGGFGWSPFSGIDYNFTPLVVVTMPSESLTKNGTTTVSQYTSLQADDLTKAAGEEEFTILALPEDGEDAAMLATAKVQVWPIASGEMSGFTPGQHYTKLPDIKIDLQDLYPSSSTYVRAYKGNPTSNPSNPIIINSSYIVLDGLVPIDRDYVITELDTFITEPGSYTLELLHETPFGIDILGQVSGLVKKSGLRVIGNLNTSE
ncbi:hypothetical protein JIN77_06490 [Verrucomicrobiaceae bacterium R5-34]|nr:hypothetical protein [Verrucomicrobiaceae bacterium R5-34]